MMSAVQGATDGMISGMVIGDTIPCVDHITGETAEKRVVSTTVNKVNRPIELDIDGEILQCTETHLFQVKGKGWVDASDLAPNDVVLSAVLMGLLNTMQLMNPIQETHLVLMRF